MLSEDSTNEDVKVKSITTIMDLSSKLQIYCEHFVKTFVKITILCITTITFQH